MPAGSNAELKSQMGEWLSTLEPWEVFATLSFDSYSERKRGSVSVAGAMYWGRRYFQIVTDLAIGFQRRPDGRWNGYGYLNDQQEDFSSCVRPRAFLACETGYRGGYVHLHALAGNLGGLERYCGEKLEPSGWGKPCCQLHAWPCGWARVLPYDPARRASWYVAKYITKQLAEWELIGFDPSRRNDG
jgi:hypothetical protein